MPDDVCAVRCAEVDRRIDDMKTEVRDIAAHARETREEHASLRTLVQALKEDLDGIGSVQRRAIASAMKLSATERQASDDTNEHTIREICTQITALWKKVKKVDGVTIEQAKLIHKWKNIGCGILMAIATIWAVTKFTAPLLLKYGG